jgi:hypothetical protein
MVDGANFSGSDVEAATGGVGDGDDGGATFNNDTRDLLVREVNMVAGLWEFVHRRVFDGFVV